MSKISLKHTSGKVVSLNSPTTEPGANDVAFKLPNADGSDGQALVTDGSGNLSFGNVAGGSARNLVINGAMQVAQRGTSSTSTGIKTVDRFQILIANTDNFAFTQKQVTDSPDGFGNSYEIDVTTAESALVADEYSLVRTTLEANTLQSLAFGTSSAKQITLSFYVKAKQTGTYASSIYLGDSGRAYTVNYTINQEATWERKTITFAGDTSGAITNDNGVGCYINWHLAAGTDYTSGTAHKNQWATFANASWAHGQTVNVLSSTDNYWKITGVQLEVGSVATDFEHLSYGDTLAKCQRYYYMFAPYVGYNGRSSYAGICENSTFYTQNNIFAQIEFPTTMRTTPSIDYSTGTNYYIIYRQGNNMQFDGSGVTMEAVSDENKACINKNGTPSNAVAGDAAIWRLNANNAYMAANAEL